jgi:hypothetical protein
VPFRVETLILDEGSRVFVVCFGVLFASNKEAFHHSMLFLTSVNIHIYIYIYIYIYMEV